MLKWGKPRYSCHHIMYALFNRAYFKLHQLCSFFVCNCLFVRLLEAVMCWALYFILYKNNCVMCDPNLENR